ncbi:hypothetical protein BIU88_03555 [Chlorobaculum limnaeum]|uniref:Uncharacterized protein n=1 Tax=Chlorobaculum limnaeum TaxID=274537 RepID=A0A1D8D5S7_CHLLM|nr:hypothetical protein BIU88_03555 [Chlorobaculum limnaeum]
MHLIEIGLKPSIFFHNPELTSGAIRTQINGPGFPAGVHESNKETGLQPNIFYFNFYDLFFPH